MAESASSAKRTSESSKAGNIRKDIPFKSALYVRGNVVKGFQRGRQMNCRTANIDPLNYPKEVLALSQGVYWTLAKRQNSTTVYDSVTSWGNNPYFKNAENTLEVHILHEFDEDFYGEELEVMICGYIRPMWDFESMEALVKWIEDDKVHATKMLTKPIACQRRKRFDEIKDGRIKL